MKLKYSDIHNLSIDLEPKEFEKRFKGWPNNTQKACKIILAFSEFNLFYSFWKLLDNKFRDELFSKIEKICE